MVLKKELDVKSLLPALTDILHQKAFLECIVATKLVKTIILATILGEQLFENYVLNLLKDEELDLPSPELFQKLPFGKLGGETAYKMTTEKRPLYLYHQYC